MKGWGSSKYWDGGNVMKPILLVYVTPHTLMWNIAGGWRQQQHPLVSKSPPTRRASANIQRCRWVFGMGPIKTIDRWLCPAAHPYDEEGGRCKSRRHAPKRLSVSTAGRDQRSQSTFIAVAGLDCVEKLTEQWVQLWPRSAQLLSPPISSPDVKDSNFLIYVLLVFHCYFLHSSSLARSLQE